MDSLSHRKSLEQQQHPRVLFRVTDVKDIIRGEQHQHCPPHIAASGDVCVDFISNHEDSRDSAARIEDSQARRRVLLRFQFGGYAAIGHILKKTPMA